MGSHERAYHKLGRRRFLGLVGGVLGAMASGCQATGRRQETQQAAPSYVDGGLDWTIPRGPYLQQDAHIAAFLLRADGQQLKRLCDRSLNAVSGGEIEYVPLVPYVCVLLADMVVSSLDARDRELGRMHERELSFWVLTLARVPAGGLWVPDHVACYIPYLFIDHPRAMLIGREVYGFPKTSGRFDGPMDWQAPAFGLDVWGTERLAPDAEDGWQRLLRVEPSGAESDQGDATWSRWDQARAAILNLLTRDVAFPMADAMAGGEEATQGLFDMNELKVPLVFVKQFRDSADPQQACYQTLVEAPAQVRQFYGGGTFEDAYRLTFRALESHPLPEQLGLALDAANGLRATASFWVHLDFELGHGHRIEG